MMEKSSFFLFINKYIRSDSRRNVQETWRFQITILVLIFNYASPLIKLEVKSRLRSTPPLSERWVLIWMCYENQLAIFICRRLQL